MITVLIDGDQLAYFCAFACETELDWGDDSISLTTSKAELRSALDNQIQKAKQETNCSEYKVGLSSDTNFRKTIYPEYKANRTGRKPLGLTYCKQYLTEEYGAESVKDLEADDLLGIWACKQKDKVIWATDKDFLTIPCFLYRKNTMHRITEKDADYNLRLQTMVGDTVDNFKGAKGFGEKTAIKWLQQHGDTWESVLKAFEKAGQTKEDCITNAKLARICRHADDVNWQPEL